MNEAERFLKEFQQKKNTPAEDNLVGPVVKEYKDDEKSIPQDSQTMGIWDALWSLSGRLDRRIYLLRQLVVFVALGVVSYMGGFMLSVTGGNNLYSQFYPFILALASLPFLVPQHIRRLHDMSLSGWWLLLFMVPVVGLLFRIFLCIKKGVDDLNQYDDVTNKESTL